MTKRNSNTPNGIAVHPDLNDLREIRLRWYDTDQLFPLTVIGGYSDMSAVGKCGRPLWRCDLTCPYPWETFIGPSPLPDPDEDVPF
jgi:hypothetical protein